MKLSSLGVLFWAPVALLTVGVGLWALRAGYVVANLTESDVIEAYAARYVDRSGVAGASRSDCVARPGGQPGVWITLTCTRPGAGTAVTYPVTRFGGLADVPPPAQDGAGQVWGS